MRRLLAVLIAGFSFIPAVHAVRASDLPIKAPGYAPASPPAYSWTGFYGGVNLGGGWQNTIDNNATVNFCGAINPAFCAGAASDIPGQLNTKASGLIGGGQIGYNWQSGPLVWGIETDFQGADIKGDANVSVTTVVPAFPGNPFTVTSTGSQKIDWFGTLRGRVGWLPVKQLLVYATGGLAYGHTQTGVSFAYSEVGVAANGSTAVSDSSTRAGWTAGGGLEWMFAPNWTLKGEYLYYDLGTVTIDQQLNVLLAGLRLIGVGIQSNADYHGSIARLGVNYKF